MTREKNLSEIHFRCDTNTSLSITLYPQNQYETGATRTQLRYGVLHKFVGPFFLYTFHFYVCYGHMHSKEKRERGFAFCISWDIGVVAVSIVE